MNSRLELLGIRFEIGLGLGKGLNSELELPGVGLEVNVMRKGIGIKG